MLKIYLTNEELSKIASTTHLPGTYVIVLKGGKIIGGEKADDSEYAQALKNQLETSYDESDEVVICERDQSGNWQRLP